MMVRVLDWVCLCEGAQSGKEWRGYGGLWRLLEGFCRWCSVALGTNEDGVMRWVEGVLVIIWAAAFWTSRSCTSGGPQRDVRCNMPGGRLPECGQGWCRQGWGKDKVSKMTPRFLTWGKGEAEGLLVTVKLSAFERVGFLNQWGEPQLCRNWLGCKCFWHRGG